MPKKGKERSVANRTQQVYEKELSLFGEPSGTKVNHAQIDALLTAAKAMQEMQSSGRDSARETKGEKSDLEVLREDTGLDPEKRLEAKRTYFQRQQQKYESRARATNPTYAFDYTTFQQTRTGGSVEKHGTAARLALAFDAALHIVQVQAAALRNQADTERVRRENEAFFSRKRPNPLR